MPPSSTFDAGRPSTGHDVKARMQARSTMLTGKNARRATALEPSATQPAFGAGARDGFWFEAELIRAIEAELFFS
jgi:hypothetical protein